MSQTLDRAVYLAVVTRNGVPVDRSLYRASIALNGLPIGSWGETEQARRDLVAHLPRRAARSYSADEFIDRCYCVRKGRYARKPAREII